MFQQTTFTFKPRSRGIHIVTAEVEAALHKLKPVQTGLAHLFLQHTSASLTINENADPDVRLDTEDWINKVAPENQPEYRHTLEGDDDLPAHFKSMMFGVSLTVPIINGQLGLGTWQGIYLCEHRDHASGRRLVLTVQGG